MLWIALATQFGLPIPVGVPDPRAVFSSDDMPAYVQVQAINRFVSTRSTVRPDGTLQDCTQERSSGDPKLDSYTCSIILRRAKFTSGSWIDGTPAFGIVRVPVTWVIGPSPSSRETERAYPPDMQISVNRLPNGASKRTKVRLKIAVEPSGEIVGCDEGPPAPEDARAKRFPELVPLACSQMRSAFRAVPARDLEGKPARSVQTALVIFSTEK